MVLTVRHGLQSHEVILPESYNELKEVICDSFSVEPNARSHVKLFQSDNEKTRITRRLFPFIRDGDTIVVQFDESRFFKSRSSTSSMNTKIAKMADDIPTISMNTRSMSTLLTEIKTSQHLSKEEKSFLKDLVVDGEEELAWDALKSFDDSSNVNIDALKSFDDNDVLSVLGQLHESHSKTMDLGLQQDTNERYTRSRSQIRVDGGPNYRDASLVMRNPERQHLNQYIEQSSQREVHLLNKLRENILQADNSMPDTPPLLRSYLHRQNFNNINSSNFNSDKRWYQQQGQQGSMVNERTINQEEVSQVYIDDDDHFIGNLAVPDNNAEAWMIKAKSRAENGVDNGAIPFGFPQNTNNKAAADNDDDVRQDIRMIGRLTLAERREKIKRYREKKKRAREGKRKHYYKKKAAATQNRKRIGGRFVKGQ
eukprot:g2413.t1